MRSIALLALSLFSLSAAADGMRPGLWEILMKSDAAREMPDISPAQLEQMRKMGIEMPTKRDGGIVQRACMTKEMAARREPPGTPRESDCKLKSQDHSGNTYRAEIVCDGPNLKGTGIMKGTYAGDTSYSSQYDFSGTSRGKPVSQHHETQGKWLSADCGNVRPMGEMFGGPKK